MFRQHSAILRQLSNLSKLLHCIFNVFPRLKHFSVFFFRHPLIKIHLFENITRYVFMSCLPPVASVCVHVTN
jgi:hypothetical protein